MSNPDTQQLEPRVGQVVHRVHMSTERSEVVAVEKNIVLRNEFGWYHTTRHEAFAKWYVEVER